MSRRIATRTRNALHFRSLHLGSTLSTFNSDIFGSQKDILLDEENGKDETGLGADAGQSSKILNLEVVPVQDVRRRRLHALRNCFNYTEHIRLLTKTILDFAANLHSSEKDGEFDGLPDTEGLEQLGMLWRFTKSWATELSAITTSSERLFALDLMEFNDFRKFLEEVAAKIKEYQLRVLLSRESQMTRSGYLDPEEVDRYPVLVFESLDFEEMLNTLRDARVQLGRKIDDNKTAVVKYEILLSTPDSDRPSVLRQLHDGHLPFSDSANGPTEAPIFNTSLARHDLINLAPETKLKLWASRVYKRAKQSTSSIFTLDSTFSAELCTSILSKVSHSDVSNTSVVGYRPKSMLLGRSKRSRLSLPVITNTMRGHFYNMVQSSGNSIQFNGNCSHVKVVINQKLHDGRRDYESKKDGTETGAVKGKSEDSEVYEEVEKDNLTPTIEISVPPTTLA